MKWSYSRRSSFETCPRQYFYKHYGNSFHFDDPVQEGRLRVGKKLSQRHFSAGNALHSVIDEYFKGAQRGLILSVDELCDLAREKFRADVDYSRRDPDGRNPPRMRKPPSLLSEFHQHLSDAEELCLEAEEKLLRAVRNFASDPEFSAVKEGARKLGSFSEKWLSFNIGCGVAGKIDLIYPEGQEWVIVDWKIGDSNGDGDDSLQLAAYALWLEREYGCLPDQIRAYKAFLGDGVLAPYSVSANDVEMAKARILQDAERMAMMDDYGQRGKVAAFTPCAQPRICRMCPFVDVCLEGKECLDLDDDEPKFLP